MKRLYEKNQLTFALIWIGVYVVSFSLADSLSVMAGTEKIITAPVCILMMAVLLGFIFRSGLAEQCGLGKKKVEHGKYLYYLPLLALASTNLWRGVTLQVSVLEAVLGVVSMLGVGVLEEVIFRGLLFQALRRDNLRRAVIISSLTFGIGHVVNLLNGAALLPTLLQIIYATAAGFLFTILFLRSGSLLWCILAHSLINSLSVFSRESTPAMDILAAVFLTVVSLAYAFWILRKTEKTPDEKEV